MPQREVTKAVIPAAGLGTRFLPATKAQPKEMLPVVDKPAIQYVVEEAVRAGIDDILIITGRGKRTLEDHFDRNFELEYYLEQKGKTHDLDEIKALAEMADIHYVRQGEPLGLGHAVSVARKHVGDNPFAVMLGDDIMDRRSTVLDEMISTYEQYGRSVIALSEFPLEEISSYGCVRPESVTDRLVRVLDIVEKPKPADAPSNLAVMGRYVFTPEIFEVLEHVPPGVGGEIQLTDAIATLLGDQTVYGFVFSEGRYDIGKKLDYLRATVELALDRDDLGPEFTAFLVETLQKTRLGLTAKTVPLVPLEEAQRFVRDRCPPLDPVPVALADAWGCVAAEDCVATAPMPPFANTAMDGFTVRASDVTAASATSPVRLRVVETLLAGVAPQHVVGAGEATRIMTGAPMPEGADAVVMVERTAAVGTDEVDITEAVAAGTNVRDVGGDIQPGDVVVAARSVLTPARVGVLAEIGAGAVRVYRRPRVGVLSTGDELVADGGPLAAGQIRDSNRPALLALVHASGFEPVDLGLARDDEATIVAAIERGAATCDALITSGGVSMGDVDLVKVILGKLADMRWMQIAIRPAKPFAFGVVEHADHVRIPVFGLPGNPVSSLVSFELLARPALKQMAGHLHLERPRVRAVVDAALPRRPDGKTHFARVVCAYDEDGRYHARSAGGQSSHQLAAMAAADGLAVLPDGDGAAAGEVVDVLLLD